MEARASRFEQTVRPCVEPLRRYLARRTDPETAADVLGDTLLVAWRRFDDVPAHALPWLYGVARNCLANAERGVRRRARLAARLAESSVEGSSADPSGAVDGASGDEVAQAAADQVHAALAALNDTEREVVRLWAWEELSAAEIAVVLGVSPNAASLRLSRARRRMREELTRGRGRRQTRDLAGHDQA
jgi:RNA polymerase sigma-70 factor (ECF subfamily)